MIKHYFCEYCGKDFLSEKGCFDHEKNCEVKVKNELNKKLEAEKKADMDKIVSSFGEVTKLCKNYMEKYSVFDIEKFSNTFRDKLSEIEDKIFEDFADFDSEPVTNFEPIELTLEDVKFNKDELDKLLGRAEPQEVKVKIKDADSENLVSHKSDDEVDAIINKLSESPLYVEHKDGEPEDVVTYYFNGNPMTENKFFFCHGYDAAGPERKI